jgi:hypothetical protein
MPISGERITIPEGLDMDHLKKTRYTASERLVFLSCLLLGLKIETKGDYHALSTYYG